MNRPAAPAEVDHFVYAVPDLDDAVARFAERTGVRPAPGGSHPGWGTRNRLVGLGDGAYLELAGPDPGQPDPDRPRTFGVDTRDRPTLVTWAVRVSGIAAVVERARAAGFDPGPVRAMSRRTPDGTLLEWQLTDPAGTPAAGLVPFLIDWGATPHPTSGPLPRLRLRRWRLTAPDPGAIQGALAALGAPAAAEEGPIGLRLELETPNGVVELS